MLAESVETRFLVSKAIVTDGCKRFKWITQSVYYGGGIEKNGKKWELEQAFSK